MQIIRGDDYQSWVYSNDDDLIVVDPWLTRRQVFPKMNWLLNRESTEEAYLLKNNLIDKVTHIIITAHFSDHLDLESLKLFNKNIPVFTTHEASKVLIKAGFSNVIVVNINNEYELNTFKLYIHKAGKPYNTTTFAYSLSNSRAKVFMNPICLIEIWQLTMLMHASLPLIWLKSLDWFKSLWALIKQN